MLFMIATIHQVTFPFAALDFYRTHAVCKVKQGVLLNLKEVEALHKDCYKYFDSKKYGYILDRTTDYTIDPLVYLKYPYCGNVSRFAIVAPHSSTKSIVQFEQKFTERELTVFDSLEQAQEWMETFDVL